MNMALRNGLGCLVVVSLVMIGSHAAAVQPDEIMRDPAQEARARALSRELRCMVCQNQSIDDSDAPLARDLRLLVRERIASGDSDRQVIDFLTARYGAFVLLKPRFEAQTLALWLLPPVALALGALALMLAARRRRPGGRQAADGDSVPLSAAEQARLADLIGEADLSSAHQATDRPRESSITKV